jgi:hypothetical protein
MQLALALANPIPGAVLTLAKGQVCSSFVYRAVPKGQVLLDATGSTLVGWRFLGSNLRVFGATIRASQGSVVGPNGYGAYVSGTNIHFDHVRVTFARKGIVGDNATNLSVTDSEFYAVFEDGMILSRIKGLSVLRSTFIATVSQPTKCKLAGRVVLALPKRVCVGQDGTWVDGYHADAIQMRNAVTDARLEDNQISGLTQGITQMDTAGDLPLERVSIIGNTIITDAPHKITLGACLNCSISGNTVGSPSGSKWKAQIIAGQAVSSKNTVRLIKGEKP